MIARGENPTAVTEASTAGAGAGDEGGSSFVVVDFNNAQGNVTSGFNTIGIPGSESTTFKELPPVEGESAPVPSTQSIVITIVDDQESINEETGETDTFTVSLNPALSTGNGVTVDITISGGAETADYTPNITAAITEATSFARWFRL